MSGKKFSSAVYVLSKWTPHSGANNTIDFTLQKVINYFSVSKESNTDTLKRI